MIVALNVYDTIVIFRKWSPVPVSLSVLLTFSSVRFSVAGFMLRPLIHLHLSFVHGDRYGSIFIFVHVAIQLYQHHLLNMLLFFPFDIFLLLCQKIRCLYVTA